MNQKELTKTVIMIPNWKKTFGLQGFHTFFSAWRVKGLMNTIRSLVFAAENVIRVIYMIFVIYHSQHYHYHHVCHSLCQSLGGAHYHARLRCLLSGNSSRRHPANTRYRTNAIVILASVADGGPILKQHWFNVPCLLDYDLTYKLDSAHACNRTNNERAFHFCLKRLSLL